MSAYVWHRIDREYKPGSLVLHTATHKPLCIHGHIASVELKEDAAQTPDVRFLAPADLQNPRYLSWGMPEHVKAVPHSASSSGHFLITVKDLQIGVEVAM